MAPKLEHVALVAGAVVAAVCLRELLRIARCGFVAGRMGGAWSRSRDPAVYWLSAAGLALGLCAGVLLLALGAGAAPRAAAAIAGAATAAAVAALARFGRRSGGVS